MNEAHRRLAAPETIQIKEEEGRELTTVAEVNMKAEPRLLRSALLIVDDDTEIREQMKWALANIYEIIQAGDRPSAVALAQREHPGLVTLDLGLPPHQDDVTEGLLALEEILMADPLTKVIVVTGNSDRAHALKAVQMGAYDYIQKPVQLKVLKVILERATYLSSLEQESRALVERTARATTSEIVGASAPIQKLRSTIRQIAGSDISVLILGESGTGKELVARAIHQQSGRKDGPFVAIDCGAIPDTLLESELFGHEKGAFTGAHVQRKGRIESAQGGTLFLDEIGELAPLLQVKLLRFLQEHQIERVGGREKLPVNVRVVAATNSDLETARKTGTFREDLYYRLCVLTITLPPLRERDGDVQVLAQVFLHRYATQAQRNVTGFTKQALRTIEIYSWPGNIRELENRIKRAVIMTQGRLLTCEDLDLRSCDVAKAGMSLKEVRETLERGMILSALTRHRGNMTKTAEELGITRPTLYDLMSKLTIRVTQTGEEEQRAKP